MNRSLVIILCVLAGCKRAPNVPPHLVATTELNLQHVASHIQLYKELKGLDLPKGFAYVKPLLETFPALKRWEGFTQVGTTTFFSDAWGGGIAYRLIDGLPFVYSFGPNQIDDSGKGDDILCPVED